VVLLPAADPGLRAAVEKALGMALKRLGRDEDARAAYAKSRELTQQRNR